MNVINQRKNNRTLTCLSMMQFDQQNTTKFHLDSAPEESYLMLGYEPSAVQSVLFMADYARAAHDLHLTPQQYLADFNPMFAKGEQRLRDYATHLESFEPARSHVLLVNNSRLAFSPGERNSLGVMHQATILTSDPARSRVVNSIMLTTTKYEEEKVDVFAMEQDFLTAD